MVYIRLVNFCVKSFIEKQSRDRILGTVPMIVGGMAEKLLRTTCTLQ